MRGRWGWCVCGLCLAMWTGACQKSRDPEAGTAGANDDGPGDGDPAGPHRGADAGANTPNQKPATGTSARSDAGTPSGPNDATHDAGLAAPNKGPEDCLGVPGGTARRDMCGVCDADGSNDCVQDCAGTWGGSARRDKCGICDKDASNDCVQDCAGMWGGPATRDCAGACMGTAQRDMCGVCDNDAGNDCVQDCAGAWGGAALRDCAGVCQGTATRDRCDVCDTDASNDCDCLGVPGGSAHVDNCGVCDDDAGNDCSADFIVDIASHAASPETNPVGALALESLVGQYNNARLPWIVRSPGVTGSGKYDRTEYAAQVLSGSDTSIGLLVGLPYAVGANGSGTAGLASLSQEDLIAVRDALASQFPGRVLTACAVMPNDRIDVQLARMQRIAGDCTVWVTRTGWQPTAGSGYWLDQGVGPRMIQAGIDLGKPIFLVSKGLSLVGEDAAHGSPSDVGPAAKRFPGATFVIQGAAFEAGMLAGQSSEPSGTFSGDYCDGAQLSPGSWPEGPYDEVDTGVQAQYPLDRGVNSLIASLRGANIGPNGRDLDDPGGPVTSHVYASLDGVWAFLMTSRHDEAQHVIGKLLKHVGEDRILWGTRGLWFGSPQPQIEAFRCFEISQAFQETYGYPALTPEIKAKILGGNAARLLSQLPGVSLP